MSESLETALAFGGVLAVLALAFVLIQRLRSIRDMRVLSADMRLAENVARIGYWSRPINSNHTVWSAGMFEIFGQDANRFTPTIESVNALFLPQDLEAIQAITNTDVAGHKGGDIEARIRCPDGKIKDVTVAIRYRVSKSPISRRAKPRNARPVSAKTNYSVPYRPWARRFGTRTLPPTGSSPGRASLKSWESILKVSIRR